MEIELNKMIYNLISISLSDWFPFTLASAGATQKHTHIWGLCNSTAKYQYPECSKDFMSSSLTGSRHGYSHTTAVTQSASGFHAAGLKTHLGFWVLRFVVTALEGCTGFYWYYHTQTGICIFFSCRIWYLQIKSDSRATLTKLFILILLRNSC